MAALADDFRMLFGGLAMRTAILAISSGGAIAIFVGALLHFHGRHDGSSWNSESEGHHVPCERVLESGVGCKARLNCG
jgi:hypothetical protein